MDGLPTDLISIFIDLPKMANVKRASTKKKKELKEKHTCLRQFSKRVRSLPSLKINKKVYIRIVELHEGQESLKNPLMPLFQQVLDCL